MLSFQYFFCFARFARMDPARKNLLTSSIPGDAMLNDNGNLDSESDVSSMPVLVRRPSPKTMSP